MVEQSEIGNDRKPRKTANQSPKRQKQKTRKEICKKAQGGLTRLRRIVPTVASNPTQTPGTQQNLLWFTIIFTIIQNLPPHRIHEGDALGPLQTMKNLLNITQISFRAFLIRPPRIGNFFVIPYKIKM
jgi:hypothetical protein